MGLFDWFYYGKAGRHDYGEMDMPTNRFSLFFIVFKDHLFDLIKLNALQLICWIPFIVWTFLNVAAVRGVNAEAVLAASGDMQQMKEKLFSVILIWMVGLVPCLAVTGPSSSGAAYVARNWARDQHAFLLSDFWDAFKSNWKQSLSISAMTGCVPIVTCIAVIFYGQLALQTPTMMLPLVLVLVAATLWLLMLPLLYGMIVGYVLEFKALLRNALLLSIAALPKLLFAQIIALAPTAMLITGLCIGNGILLFFGMMYYLLIGFAFSRLVYASVANGIFDQYLHSKIDGAPTRSGLRPKPDDEEDAC